MKEKKLKRKQRLKEAKEGKLQELEEPSETSPKVIFCVCVSVVCALRACPLLCVCMLHIFLLPYSHQKNEKGASHPQKDQKITNRRYTTYVFYQYCIKCPQSELELLMMDSDDGKEHFNLKVSKPPGYLLNILSVSCREY